MVVRTYRQKDAFYIDESFYVLIPSELMTTYLKDRIRRTATSKLTMNIGFSKEQKEQWASRGVKFYPVFSERVASKEVEKPVDDQSSRITPRRRLDSSLIDYVKRNDISKTESNLLVKARVGQSMFRNVLLERDYGCRLCHLSHEHFLIASHIKPWSESDNKERLDPNNGFLLCVAHDALFDKGYISFDDNGKILLSSYVDEKLQKAFNVNSQMVIKLSGSQKKYIAFHRDHRFIK